MKPTLILPRAQSGFGLVELMIAMTLGLVLLGSLGYVFLGTRGAFRVTDNLSRMQENARYALEVIGRDVRMAGYAGCVNLATAKVNTIASPPVPAIGPGNALIGYPVGVVWVDETGLQHPLESTRVAGDVLSIMGAFGGEVNLTGNLIPANAQIQINGNPHTFAQNDVLIVTDCSAADVFRVTNTPGSSGTVTLTHSTASNCTRNTATGACTSGSGNRVGTYGTDAFVMRMDQFTYFIRLNPANNPALYRVGLDGIAEELVENVADMRFRYGLDTTGDGAVDSYDPNPGNWAQVVSVTINLLMRSPDNNVATSPQTATFNNTAFNAAAGDRRLYQVYSATVGVRNRLPVQ